MGGGRGQSHEKQHIRRNLWLVVRRPLSGSNRRLRAFIKLTLVLGTVEV